MHLSAALVRAIRHLQGAAAAPQRGCEEKNIALYYVKPPRLMHLKNLMQNF